jgi:hypothetical protein
MIDVSIKIIEFPGNPDNKALEISFNTPLCVYCLYRPLSKAYSINQKDSSFNFMELSFFLTGVPSRYTFYSWDMCTSPNFSLRIDADSLVSSGGVFKFEMMISDSGYMFVDRVPDDVMRKVWNELIRQGFRPMLEFFK